MNYLYAGGINEWAICDGHLPESSIRKWVDYSDTDLNNVALAEASLDDSPVVGLGTQVLYFLANTSFKRCAPAGGAVDWDGDPSTTTCSLCDVNVNGDHRDRHKGYNDWENLTHIGITGFAGTPFEEEPIDARAIGSSMAGVIVVEVDVKPGSDEDPVNVESRGLVPVAVLDGSVFSPEMDLDLSSVRFGRAGLWIEPERCTFEHVGGGPRLDLLCHLATSKMELTRGETELRFAAVAADELVKEKYLRTPIVGRTTIRVVPPR
jgi:hypothetical protein